MRRNWRVAVRLGGILIASVGLVACAASSPTSTVSSTPPAPSVLAHLADLGLEPYGPVADQDEVLLSEPFECDGNRELSTKDRLTAYGYRPTRAGTGFPEHIDVLVVTSPDLEKLADQVRARFQRCAEEAHAHPKSRPDGTFSAFTCLKSGFCEAAALKRTPSQLVVIAYEGHGLERSSLSDLLGEVG